MNCLAGITGGWFLFQAKKGHPLSPQNYFCLPLSSAEFSFLALGRPAHELTLFLIINIRFSGVRVFYTIRVFKCFVLFGLNFRTWRSTFIYFWLRPFAPQKPDTSQHFKEEYYDEINLKVPGQFVELFCRYHGFCLRYAECCWPTSCAKTGNIIFLSKNI